MNTSQTDLKYRKNKEHSHAGVSFICSLPGCHKMFENKTSKGTPFGMKSPVAKILVSKMNESPQAVLLTIPVTDYE